MKKWGLPIAAFLIFGILLFAVSKSVIPGQGVSNSPSPQVSPQVQSEAVEEMEDNMAKEHTLPKPQLTIDKTKTYTITLHTSEGDISIELDASNTPVASNNFLYLAKQGFYDNTIFHRVIKGFMVQGGDPLGTGMGGPGYQFDDEPVNAKYSRGTVAMANSGPNTNGSQFFIMHQDYPLPPNYVIFGKVVAGMETVDKIAEAQVETNRFGEPSTPVNPVKINSAEIEER